MKNVIKDLLTSLQEQSVIEKEDVIKIQENFNTKFDAYIKAALVEKEEELDESYTNKLDSLLKAINKNHSIEIEKLQEANDNFATKKLQEVIDHLKLDDEYAATEVGKLVEKMDEFAAEKLSQIIEGYENKIKTIKEETSSKIDEQLTEDTSKFLDTFLEKSIPTKKLVETAKLSKLEKVMTEMKKLMLFTEDYVEEEMNEALQDAKSIIEEKDKEISKLMEEKIKAVAESKKVEASNFLKEKTEGMDIKLKSYLFARFNDSSVEDINEDIDDAISSFKLSEKTRLEEVKRQSKSIIKEDLTKPEIKPNNTPIITEQSNIDYYASIIEKRS